ncbi:MAG TPA: DUF4129 domain-containing protein [Thermoplasmata archaeon]|nr:DUF4129 domain-containing protein [Thermoplasmata archaeon]
MSRRSGARADPEIRVVERIRAVEVPVLTETKRRLGRGETGAAVRYAYPQVVADLERAYGRPFAVGWTHEEILRVGFQPEMEPLREFFEALWRLYEPFRYGDRAPPPDGRQVLELLQSLYAAPPMWRLYLASAAPEEAAPREGTAENAPTETESVG